MVKGASYMIVAKYNVDFFSETYSSKYLFWKILCAYNQISRTDDLEICKNTIYKYNAEKIEGIRQTKT